MHIYVAYIHTVAHVHNVLTLVLEVGAATAVGWVGCATLSVSKIHTTTKTTAIIATTENRI